MKPVSVPGPTVTLLLLLKCEKKSSGILNDLIFIALFPNGKLIMALKKQQIFMKNSRWKPQERSAGPVGGAPDVSLNGPTIARNFIIIIIFVFGGSRITTKLCRSAGKFLRTRVRTLRRRRAPYTYITTQQEPYIFNENPLFFRNIDTYTEPQTARRRLN